MVGGWHPPYVLARRRSSQQEHQPVSDTPALTRRQRREVDYRQVPAMAIDRGVVSAATVALAIGVRRPLVPMVYCET